MGWATRELGWDRIGGRFPPKAFRNFSSLIKKSGGQPQFSFRSCVDNAQMSFIMASKILFQATQAVQDIFDPVALSDGVGV